MTLAKMHSFFEKFTFDPDTFKNPFQYTLYIYDAQAVDALYTKHKQQGKCHFAIMRGNEVIGDIYLKHVNHPKNVASIV